MVAEYFETIAQLAVGLIEEIDDQVMGCDEDGKW